MRRETVGPEDEEELPPQPSWRSRPEPVARLGGVGLARKALAEDLRHLHTGGRGDEVQSVLATLAAVVRCADAVSLAMVPHYAQSQGYRPESLGASRVATVITEAAKLAGIKVAVPAPPLPPPVTGAIDPDSDLDDWAYRDAAAAEYAARMKRGREQSLAKSKAVAKKWDRRRANSRSSRSSRKRRAR